MSEHRAARLLRIYRHMHKLGWKMFKSWVDDHQSLMEDMPSWCLLPDQAFGDIGREAVKTYTPVIYTEEQVIRDTNTFRFLGLWRLSKGVYRMSPEIMAELKRTKISGDIPASVLKRLPEWCVYIELDGAFESDSIKHYVGAWANLNYDFESGRSELAIIFDVDSDVEGESAVWPFDVQMMVCVYDLSSGTVDDAAAKCHREMRQVIQKYGLAEDLALTEDVHNELLSTTLNALLYICSSEPDIEDREEPEAKPTHALPQRVGKRDMFVAADRVRIWNVGDKIGEVIRQQRESIGDRKHTRRHLRRAHWHGYWTGARGSEEREFSYKWLSPMVVGVSA